MSTIISRAGWNSRGPKSPFSYLNKKRVVGIAIHHSGVKNGPKGVTAVRAFERHHMLANGWNAIAYNWLIDEQGVIYEGRGAGVVSAATRPYNSRTESICYTGDGDKKIPAKTRASLTWLIGDIQKRYNKKLWVKGHRELASTSCPGNVLFDWVKDHRNGITKAQPKSKPATKKSTKTVKQGAKGIVDAFAEIEALVTSRPLKKGAKGAAVKVVQQLLAAKGLYRYKIDSDYGRLTRKAVVEFQKRRLLYVDGVVGPNTWKALLR